MSANGSFHGCCHRSLCCVAGASALGGAMISRDKRNVLRIPEVESIIDDCGQLICDHVSLGCCGTLSRIGYLHGVDKRANGWGNIHKRRQVSSMVNVLVGFDCSEHVPIVDEKLIAYPRKTFSLKAEVPGCRITSWPCDIVLTSGLNGPGTIKARQACVIKTCLAANREINHDFLAITDTPHSVAKCVKRPSWGSTPLRNGRMGRVELLTTATAGG